MSRHADQMLIHQTLLDEAHGNVSTAFEIACARLATSIHGTSWAFLYRMNPATEGRIDDVPNPVDDNWISTGREAAE